MADQTVFPPVAKRVPYSFTRHGHQIQDEYAWLQNKNDPEVIAYLEAENQYARATLAHTEALQEQLFTEMKARIPENDESAKEYHGGFAYFWRIAAGEQYRRFFRHPVGDPQAETLLVDENELALGHSFCKVTTFEPSPDHRLLAFGVDTTGSWIEDLYIKDMATGQIISGPLPMTAFSAAWASDSLTLFYTVYDQSHRPYKVYRLRAGQGPQDAREVYHETDDSFNIHVRRTRSGNYILMTVYSQSSSEVRFLEAGKPEGDFTLVEPRAAWLEYYVEEAGNQFYIRCNEQAENFKLLTAPTSSPGKAAWQELIPHRPETLLEGVEAFHQFLVLSERTGGLVRLRLSGLDGTAQARYIPMPEPAYTVREANNPDFETSAYRFVYSSLITPETTVDYGVQDGKWTVARQQVISSGYDRTQFTAERVFATASDGAQIPLSIAYRKGTPLDGSAPLLLTGYGSYGFSLDPAFDAQRLSLLERGFVYAMAHIRGGSEMGRRWYEDGRLMHKKNSFTDFIACAEHLIANQYTSAQRLAVRGGSAGGLLVTACANLRPELFKAVVAMVPFTNVICAMLDPDLPLTVVEYDQWGNPADKQAFDYMLSYSPYENIRTTAYPAMYVKAGLNDLQVPYWDPAKWVARLRTKKTDHNPLVLVTNMGAGHSGASGRYDSLKELAQVFGFLIDVLK